MTDARHQAAAQAAIQALGQLFTHRVGDRVHVLVDDARGPQAGTVYSHVLVNRADGVEAWYVVDGGRWVRRFAPQDVAALKG